MLSTTHSLDISCITRASKGLDMTRFQTTIGELYELEHRNDNGTDNTIQTDRDSKDQRTRKESDSTRKASDNTQDHR